MQTNIWKVCTLEEALNFCNNLHNVVMSPQLPMLHGAQCTASQQPRQLPLYHWPMQLAAQLVGQWLHKRLFYDTMGHLCSGKIWCQWYLEYEMNLPFHRHKCTFQISLWKSSNTFCRSIWFTGFTPKTPLWQCQHCKVPRHLDVNTHEAPVGENNRISHNSGWLFGNFAMASILIALWCENNDRPTEIKSQETRFRQFRG